MTQTPLDVPAAILQRRSIKSFKPDAIAPELLQQLIELTVAAPSSWNLQDWRIVVVQNEAKKAELKAACFNQSMVSEAPVSFVFAASTTAWQPEDLAPIFEQAKAAGAWDDGTIGYFSKAIPQFQKGLGDKTREFAIKDAMIASNNFVLAAESLGLSTCYMNGWIEDKVKAVIGAEDREDIVIAVVVPVGYAKEGRNNPGRLPLSTNVFVDTISQPYQR
ncbi:MAG: nitroreductase family protein [Cyanobacteria bacterium P01_H01_bin.15]